MRVPGEVLAMSLMMGASPSCSRISSLFSCVRALSAMAPTMLVSTWSWSTITLPLLELETNLFANRPVG